MSLESAAGGGGDTNRKAVSVGTEGGLHCWTEGSWGVTGEKVREQDKIRPQGLEAAQILHLVKWGTCLPVQETEETQVPSLGHEDPLEEGMTTNFSILDCRIPWRGLEGYTL